MKMGLDQRITTLHNGQFSWVQSMVDSQGDLDDYTVERLLINDEFGSKWVDTRFLLIRINYTALSIPVNFASQSIENAEID